MKKLLMLGGGILKKCIWNMVRIQCYLLMLFVNKIFKELV